VHFLLHSLLTFDSASKQLARDSLVDQYDPNIQELMEKNVITHLVLFIYLIEPLFNKNWFLNPNPTHSFIALGL